jgi:predicted DNA-binding protein
MLTRGASYQLCKHLSCLLVCESLADIYRIIEGDKVVPSRHKKRVQLGIIVSRETKKTVADLARDSGRSQGQVCEELIEKGLAYDSTLAEIRNELEAIRKGNAETEWRRAGYTPVHTAHGIVWCPRSYPGLQQPEPAEVPSPEPLSEEEAARNLRDHEEYIAGLGAPRVASVPFMVTQDMKRRLRARGLSDEEITCLTPQQAWEILA